MTWPEQIKVSASADVHVDNYARDGAGNKEIESILKHLVKTNGRYDAILIMDHYGHEGRAVDDGVAFKDWGHVTAEKYFLKSPVLIAQNVIDAFTK